MWEILYLNILPIIFKLKKILNAWYHDFLILHSTYFSNFPFCKIMYFHLYLKIKVFKDLNIADLFSNNLILNALNIFFILQTLRKSYIVKLAIINSIHKILDHFFNFFMKCVRNSSCKFMNSIPFNLLLASMKFCQ